MGPRLVATAAAMENTHHPLLWQQWLLRCRSTGSGPLAVFTAPARASTVLGVHITLIMEGDATVRVGATPAKPSSVGT